MSLFEREGDFKRKLGVEILEGGNREVSLGKVKCGVPVVIPSIKEQRMACGRLSVCDEQMGFEVWEGMKSYVRS